MLSKEQLKSLTLYIESGECLLDIDKCENDADWDAIFGGSRRADQRYVRVSDLLKLLLLKPCPAFPE